jgi:putative transposase
VTGAERGGQVLAAGDDRAEEPGVEDVLIAVVDGLKGFPDAITAVFPQATVQTCIVHLLRHGLDFVSWKDRKPVAAALKDIYRAVDAAAGEAALIAFDEGVWGRKYPAIGQSWRRAWSEVTPFYFFPTNVRRILYTTNAIEALNSKLPSTAMTTALTQRVCLRWLFG